MHLDGVDHVIVETLSLLGRNPDFHTSERFLSRRPCPAGWPGVALIFLDDFSGMR